MESPKSVLEFPPSPDSTPPPSPDSTPPPNPIINMYLQTTKQGKTMGFIDWLQNYEVEEF